MNNITITDKGKYYESSCGAWSRDGVHWTHESGAIYYTDSIPLRLAFKQQILDGQDVEPEPEVFTDDPSKWGRGVYRDAQGCFVVVSGSVWVWISNEGDVRRWKSVNSTYTRISTNPADIISDKVLGVE